VRCRALLGNKGASRKKPSDSGKGKQDSRLRPRRVHKSSRQGHLIIYILGKKVTVENKRYRREIFRVKRD